MKEKKVVTKVVTRKDVAKYAGVSETIVSYVMNNNRYVAQEKREKVLEAVEKLHYKPNTVAQMLKGKKSNHLIFVADNIANEHFGKIVAEMDKFAYDKGYLISLVSHRNENSFISQITSRYVDGIIISAGTFEEKYVQKLVATGIPVVIVMSREYENVTKASKIYTGLKNGIKENINLLAQKGRKNIVYIDRVSANNRFSDSEDFRFTGFCKQMKLHGLKVDESNMITGYTSEEELYQGFKKNLEDGLIVDGIIGRNDNLACVAMTAVMDFGLRVPEDVSVIGCDNSRLGNYVSPKLTSIEIDRTGIAKAIITMMEELINGGEATVQNFDTKLILRESL